MAKDVIGEELVDIEAERAVLAAMMIDSGKSVMLAFEKLTDEDFSREDHRLIFKAMLDIYSEGNVIDLLLVSNKLESENALDKIGGIAFLAELQSSLPTTANIVEYVKIVEGKALIRKLNKEALDIAKLTTINSITAEEAIEQAESKIFNILQKRKNTDSVDMKESMKLALEKLEERCLQKGKVSGIPTGFIDLDEKMLGLHTSNLIVVGARPAMGKTAFALNIALNAALKENTTVAIFSLEMAHEELTNRLISSYAEIDAKKIKNGSLNDEDWEKIAEVTSLLSKLPIIISDKSNVTASSLRAQCRKLKLEKNIGLVVIDYIQLMEASGRVESRQQMMSDISRTLKLLAKELQIPVIALTQLNRSSEKREDHRPVLADIRESGAIEQDADVVMFLHRESYYDVDKKNPENDNKAEIIIAKNRAGDTGIVELAWFGKYTKFKNLYKDSI